MSRFRANCSKCCGLCCVVPSFFAAQGFGENKRAEAPCAHLVRGSRCSIHATRELHGYIACQGFDCYGAGQWITQDLFNGATWSDAADMAQAMFDAYRFWQPRFEAAALLEASLPFVRANARHTIAERIERLSSTDSSGAGVSIDSLQLRRDTLALIRSALQGSDLHPRE